MPVLAEPRRFDIAGKALRRRLHAHKQTVLVVGHHGRIMTKYLDDPTQRVVNLLRSTMGEGYEEPSPWGVTFWDISYGRARKAAERIEDYPSAEDQVSEIERENARLRNCVERHLPHKRALNVALLFIMFFSGVLTVQSFSGLALISPLLGWLGLAFSGISAFFSVLAGLEWRNWKSEDQPGRL